MGLKGLVVFNTAVDQLKSSARNIEAINAARARNEQAKAKQENDRKMAELKLKNMEITGEGNALQNKMLKMQMDEYFKQQGTISDGHEAMIDQAEAQAHQGAQQAAVVAKTAYMKDPDVRSVVAQHVQPRYARVAGPQGGTVVGKMDAPGNTPAVNPNPLEPVYGSGGRLTKFTQKEYKNSNHDKALKLAREMAKDDQSELPAAEKVRKYLPEAKRIINDEPPVDERSDIGGVKMDKVYNQDDGGKVEVIGPDGRRWKLPTSQLAEAKKQGFRRAP